jgi:hypothetical protein
MREAALGKSGSPGDSVAEKVTNEEIETLSDLSETLRRQRQFWLTGLAQEVLTNNHQLKKKLFQSKRRSRHLPNLKPLLLRKSLRSQTLWRKKLLIEAEADLAMERKTANIVIATTSLPVVLPLTPTTIGDTKTRKKIPKKILRKIQRRIVRKSRRKMTKRTRREIMEATPITDQREVQVRSLEQTREERMKELLSREKEMSRERLSLARFSENTTIIDVKVRFKSSYR